MDDTEYGCRMAHLVSYDSTHGKPTDGYYKNIIADNVIFAAKKYIESICNVVDVQPGHKVLVRDYTGYNHCVVVIETSPIKVQLVTHEGNSSVY